jgi:chromosome segregation ATPase
MTPTPPAQEIEKLIAKVAFVDSTLTPINQRIAYRECLDDALALLASETQARQEAEEALRAIQQPHWCQRAQDAESALTAERSARQQAERATASDYSYLVNLFAVCAPRCQPLPTLSGIITQLDNYIDGCHQRLTAAEQARAQAEQELTVAVRQWNITAGDRDKAEHLLASLRTALENRNRTIAQLRSVSEPYISEEQRAAIEADVYARLQSYDAEAFSVATKGEE